jgi:hypothetical protein
MTKGKVCPPREDSAFYAAFCHVKRAKNSATTGVSGHPTPVFPMKNPIYQ